MDKDLLETERLADKISEIMDMYFSANKKLDNLMDWLDITCNMNNLSGYIHKIAHTAPLIADHFRDFNAVNSRRTWYKTIQGENKDFDNLLEPFEEFLQYIVSIQNEINNGIDIAKEDDNTDAVEFLLCESKTLREYKKQFVLFVDKISFALNEGITYQQIDHDWEDYVVMEV